MTVTRFDQGALQQAERTPEGFLRVPAAITRVGVLTYRDVDGNEWGELKPPDEVFSPESLATLPGRPVTDGHPDSMVTAENARGLTRGTVGDAVQQDGGLVVATLNILDGDLIRAIDAGARHDVSAGYVCEIDPTPGVYDGVAYKQIQRNVRFNHVAVLPQGAGRAGEEVSLRMNGAAVEVVARANASGKTAASTPATREPEMRMIKFGGKEYRCDDDAQMAALEKDATAAVSSKSDDVAAMMKQMTELLGQIAALQAKLQAAEQAEEAAEPAMDGEPVPEDVLDAAGIKRDPKSRPMRFPARVLDELVARRDALRADAAKVLGKDVDLTGKTTVEIKRAVLAKIAPKLRTDSLDAAALDASFAAVLEAYTPRNDAMDALGKTIVLNGVEEPRKDSLEDAQNEMTQREIERGRRPLGAQAK